MGLLLNSVRWDSVFVRYPGPKTHLHVLRPEKNRQFADGRGFNSRHLHQCEVSGHRSVDVPRLFVFGGVDVSRHRSLFVGGCVGSSFPFFVCGVLVFWLVVFGRVDCVFGDDFSGCFVDCDGVGSVD